MSWKKHFKLHSSTSSPLTHAGHDNMDSFGYGNWASHLPDVYTGHPNRIERYAQYENMDADAIINAAMDIIARSCTQKNVENGTAFDIHFNETATDNEIKLLRESLAQWWKINDFEKRIFKLFRNVIKYGDQIFIRDPETMELFWVAMEDVIKVIVNEGNGKETEQYVIKNINPNFENLTMTQHTHQDATTGVTSTGTSVNQSYLQPAGAYTTEPGSRFEKQINENAIAAEHIVHCSLTEGLDVSWPFGTSVLEKVYKVFKQKELLEDAILIYRIQRAPERRVFKIDVGNMPAHMAMAFVERVKNEIHQKRLPSQSGGNNMMDATYNPLSTGEDYFFPTTAEGRGSSVETLQGGQNLGEIDDLLYFNNLLLHGLRVPKTYVSTFSSDGNSTYSDGRLGQSLMEEQVYNDHCIGLQNLISPTMDQEFKIFLANRGIEIDNGVFSLRFNEPQNFAAYRQVEVDSSRIGVYTQLKDEPYISKRFAMKRYLGMTEEEMQENDELWAEENGTDNDLPITGESMRGIGMSPGGFESDMDLADPEQPDFGDDLGAEEDLSGDASGEDLDL